MNNNTYKSILITLTLLILPIIVFAQPAADQPSPTSRNNQGSQLEKPTGPGTSADNPLVECGGVDKDGRDQPLCDIGHANRLIQSVLNLVFIFAGFIVASMFMYAGFLLITSAGNTSQIQKAKDVFKRVVIGFLIMFMSYLIVKNLLTNIDAADFFIKLFKR